ncbi:MAG: hypothetical protein ACTHXF_08985 [Brevibacterium yomogidense]
MAAPTPLADTTALSEWLGEPITEEEDVSRAEWALRNASVLVRAESGKSWTDDTGTLGEVPEEVTVVTLQCAARGYTNPESWANEGVDDWRGGGRPIDELGLYLTATEKRLLAAHRPAKPSGIGVLATTRMPAPAVGAGWVPTEGGPPFPWY